MPAIGVVLKRVENVINSLTMYGKSSNAYGMNDRKFNIRKHKKHQNSTNLNPTIITTTNRKRTISTIIIIIIPQTLF